MRKNLRAAIQSGIVFWLAGRTVVADPAELDELWSWSFGSPVTAAPALLPEGGPVIGCQGNANPNDNSLPNIGGILKAFTASGTSVWSIAPFGGVGATATVADSGAVFIGSLGTWIQGSRQYAVTNGFIAWSASHERAVVHAAALAEDGTVYFLTTRPIYWLESWGGRLPGTCPLGSGAV